MRRKISVMKRGIPHITVRAMKKAPVLPSSSASSPASTPAQPKEQRSELTKTNRVAEEEIPPSASPDHGEWDAGFSSTAHPGQPAFRGFLVSQALREPSGARHLSSTGGTKAALRISATLPAQRSPPRFECTGTKPPCSAMQTWMISAGLWRHLN